MIIITLIASISFTTSASKTIYEYEKEDAVASKSSGLPDLIVVIHKCRWKPLKKELLVSFEKWNIGEEVRYEGGVHYNTSLVIDGELYTTFHSQAFWLNPDWGSGIELTLRGFTKKPTYINVTVDCYNKIEESNEKNNYAVQSVSGLSGKNRLILSQPLMHFLDRSTSFFSFLESFFDL